MKVLDFESIKKYSYMVNSLSFVALGDLEEAVISAYSHLFSDAQSDKARLDISLYIAKIYSKMGEFQASSNILFSAMIYGIEEGRIYALLAYNYFKMGDRDNAILYNTMMNEWNRRHDNILEIEQEYDLAYSIMHMDNTPRTHVRCKGDDIIANAWELAKKGNTQDARSLCNSVCEECCVGDKFELLASLDIADNTYSVELDEVISHILTHDIEGIDIMNGVYLLERLSRYDIIAKLIEKSIKEKMCTSRLAYMYAIALSNIGKVDLSIKILSRISACYGHVFPYMRVAHYFLKNKRNLHIEIYKDDNALSTLDLLRDSELCMNVLGGNVASWKDNDDVIAMIRALYQDNVITKVVTSVTRELASSSEGRRILKSVLLDCEVTSGKMKMYVAKSLMTCNVRLIALYQGVLNSCTYREDGTLSAKDREVMRDSTAFNLIAGN